MDTTDFNDLEEEFQRRVSRIVWCSVATVDRSGRPRSRILHPIWEGTTGWIATGRQTLKTKHLAANDSVSLCYWDPDHQQIYAECRAEWADDITEKQRIWDLFKSTPGPLGYDPAMIWPDGADAPGFGILKLTPWRIELSSISEMSQGKAPLVWRAPAD